MDLNISAPCLTDLSVASHPFPLRIEYGLHSNLKNLNFTGSINGAPFLMEQYHILLSSAPNLEEIQIHRGADLPSPAFQIRTPVEIQLYNLRRLVFWCHHWDVIIALASSIVIAQDRLPFCKVTARHLVPFPPIMFPENIRQDTILSTACNSEWLKAQIDTEEDDNMIVILGLDPTTEPLYFQMECESERPMGVLSGIIETGSFQRIRIVELEGCRLFSYGDLPWTNSSFPCLKVLRIRSLYRTGKEEYASEEEVTDEEEDIGEEDTTPVIRLIRKLSSPVSSPQGTFWICPKLRHIAFDCSISRNSLVQLLKARCRDSDYIIGSSDGLHRLELVEVSNFSEYEWTEEKLARLAAGYDIQARCRDLDSW